MEIEIKKSSASELRFVLKGEKEFNRVLLLNGLPHPLGEDSEFIVKTKGKNAKAAVTSALKKIEKQLAEFEKAFKAAK